MKSYGKQIHEQRKLIFKNQYDAPSLHARSKGVWLRGLISYLFWNLAKVADISQDCGFDEGIFGILSASLGIEVGMECVDTFYCSGTLLPVSKDQVDPQVEVGTDIFAFKGLKQTEQELLHKLVS